MNDTSPIEDDLTDEQRRELVEDLQRLHQELQQHLETTKEGARPVELDQQMVGRISRMDAIQHQQIAVASRRLTELRIKQTVAALAAARRDEYGYCRRCEEPIGFRRLKARPESPFCLRCQGAAESR